jgi:hypothetical protein
MVRPKVLWQATDAFKVTLEPKLQSAQPITERRE